MRSLPLHTSTQRCDRCTCTHAHTHNLNSDTIAAGAYTYTAIRSLPLHTPTHRYDRCHCIHLHSYTIAATAHARTAIRSLFMNAPAKPCNLFLHEHTETQSDAIRFLLGRTDHCKTFLSSLNCSLAALERLKQYMPVSTFALRH